MVVFLLAPTNGAAQTKVYATGATTTTPTYTAGVTNSYDQNMATAAELSAYSGVKVVVVLEQPYSSNIELSFTGELPANTTSYVKVATDEPNILHGLVGGSLGAVLSALLVGGQEFTVEAKNNLGAVVLTGQSQVAGDFNSTKLSVVINAAGEYLLKITPDQPYKSIKITNRYASILGLGVTKKLYVYEAYHETAAPVCLPNASYTSTNGSGISASLLTSNTVGVVNPQNAIDANPNNYSILNMGLLSAGGAIEQVLHYDVLSGSTDSFAVTFSPPQALINALSSVTVIASNGNTVVQTKTLTELLALLSLTPVAGQPNTVYMTPGSPVNKITIRIASVLNVAQTLNFYGATRILGPPVITQNLPVCSGSSTTLIITGTLPGTSINWYNNSAGGTPLYTSTSGQAVPTPVLSASGYYYVQQVIGGCTGVLLPVLVTVVAKPTPGTLSAAQVICTGKTPAQITSATGESGAGITYRWESSVNGTAWQTVNGANLITYQPPALTATMFYRRVTIRTASGINCYSDPTAPVKITVNSCQLITNPMVMQRVRNGA